MPPEATNRIDDLEKIYARQADTVYRICYGFLKNKADAEDAVQETFLKLLQYLQNGKTFSDESHEKAWLIVTASNFCKNMIQHWTRKQRQEVEDWETLLGTVSDENREDQILIALMKLPNQYRLVLYLYYYEAYHTAEIAEMLKKKEATIRTLLRRGRMKLKDSLGGDF